MDPTARKINKRFRPFVTFELTNCCNLRCPMCTVSSKDPLDKGIADTEIFRAFLQGIEQDEFYCEDLRIFWVGDPLLHTDFVKIIDLLACSKAVTAGYIKRIGFDTNATYLDNEKTDALIRLGRIIPVHIIFSLDAITEESYAKIRVGGDFNRVLTNIKNFYTCRTRAQAQYPKALVQFVIQQGNAKEIPECIRYFSDFFASLSIKNSILLNASFGECDGITLRPLTEQNDSGVLQKEANELYESVCRNLGLISENETIAGISQGGGSIHIT